MKLARLSVFPQLFGKPRPVTEQLQTLSFSRRAVLLSGAQAAMGGLLVLRMGYISVFENQRYQLLSESNRVNITLIPPRRGLILDRKGVEIATNRVELRADLIPGRMRDRDATLDGLARLLSLPADDIERIREELKAAPPFRPVELSGSLTQQQYDAINVRLPEFQGVAPERGFSRYYPLGAAVAHLVGYVGAATAEQYRETKDPLYVTPGFKLGKGGLEKVMDRDMRGKPGARRNEVTAKGKLVRELDTRRDIMGNTVHLTIDADLQEYVARRIGPESGSCTVIDLHTGDVLAFASMPAFDPNSFSRGIGRAEWRALNENDHKPLLNKTTQGLYPPGSTLKPMAALAALTAGLDPHETFFCGGGFQLGRRFFRCEGHHGAVDLSRGVAKSCNTYFYNIANRYGYDTIARVARALGLGQRFDLPLQSQYYGTIPDSAWKMAKYKQPWTKADSLNATIGQGYVSVSPFQLAVMMARIASGRALTPRLLAAKTAPAPILPFGTEHFQVVRDAMFRVVNVDGTAVRSRLPFPDIHMGGKTGSAQVRAGARGQGGAGTVYKYRDHGLFVGFAPTEAPRYAISVVIEHGIAGAASAAPVAGDVMTFLFDRAKAMAKLDSLERSWGGNLASRMAARAVDYGLAPLPGTQATPPSTTAPVQPSPEASDASD